MNLPSYFLADMPPEASLTPGLVTEACQTLRRNGAQYLAPRSTSEIVGVISRLANDWRLADFPFRQYVLQHAPQATGFSEQTIAHGLDQFFRELTEENLEHLLQQELGDARRLDHFTTDQRHRAAMAIGPRLIAHIAPGNIPTPVLLSMVLGLLTRSAQFIKCSARQGFIPRMFAHSLYAVAPKLGACLEIAEWKGGHAALEAALFAEADCVTATGSDATLEAIRARLPARIRFLGYGTRVSVGYVTRDALSVPHPARIAVEAAKDVAAWNQLGCLSPHIIYVENGGTVPPEDFASLLADELQSMESSHPRGNLSHHESAAIATRRAFYEVRAAHSPETKMWASPQSTAWTVIFENDPRFQLSCLNRFIYVKAVNNLQETLNAIEPHREQLSTIGLTCVPLQMPDLALELARWGVPRVCPMGQMQNPPLAWRHDGRPALADLVTWCDWEKSTI
jgi:hypothetical protein